MTPEKLVEELDQRLKLPGLANVWVPPIRNRIDMLATGIKSPVGIKVAGADPVIIDRIAQQIEQAVRAVPGVTSALAERLTSGRYIEIDIDRDAAARYNMNIVDVQSVIAAAVGGEICVLLYMTFQRIDEALLIMATLPLALIGGFWFIYLLGHQVSVATAVGFIALAGVAAEFGVVTLIYLKHAWEERLASGAPPTCALLDEAIREGAVMRVRPKAMTVTVIVAGLLPIMWSHGTGSEVMQRIAAPMIGGMITAPLLSLLVIPALYRMLRRRDCVDGPGTPSQSVSSQYAAPIQPATSRGA